MTSNEENKALIGSFESKRNGNTLGDYLRNNAWTADLDGETRIYLVKDPEGRIALFFSLKCGLLFNKNQYDKLNDDERAFVDMVVDAKRNHDDESLESYYTYGSAEYPDIDRLFEIADKRISKKEEGKELGDDKNSLKVAECFSGMELQHFCKNESYQPLSSSKVPLGFGLFWEIIVPKILEITKTIGCKYLYLFAADKSEKPDIQELVRYYKDDLKFYECEEDDIIIIKPEYDQYCYGLVEEISKLAENRETVWEEFSDIWCFDTNKRAKGTALH